ncbi:hypothetical protein [Marinisporobacter balticus]|uniref:Uncharacterized protein n=1 Tax=Marinisporobacter balticus TaxID=2018667 RepID=A0A4R2K965_9FIRM|nr:hypothetical protein [Marinisporobacter balticus]TCO69234.1 hypothetical protein EV214_13310 [Marinisporobacter balticus]
MEFTTLNGVNVSGVSISDIECIINLRNDWKYILKTIGEPLNLEYICKVYSEVARNEALEWGILRNGKVGISRISYIPPIPDKNDVESELNKIFNLPTRGIKNIAATRSNRKI